MSIGTYVVNNTQSVDPTCKAILGFRSVLDADQASYSVDASYPIENALDQKYNTEFAPNFSFYPTSAIIEFTLTSVQLVNYFMIISKNAEESELSVIVEVFRSDTAAYEQVAGFGSMTDGLPVMVYFGDNFDSGYASALRIKITLSYISVPYIMSMMCGDAIVFPRTFSLGFQLPSLASLDEVRQFEAEEGLNIVSGRRLARGNQARGSINFVRMTTVRSFWKEFQNHVLDSKPLCLMWNDQDPTEIIYGVQNPSRLTKPTYKTSLFTQLDFDIVGWA